MTLLNIYLYYFHVAKSDIFSCPLGAVSVYRYYSVLDRYSLISLSLDSYEGLNNEPIYILYRRLLCNLADEPIAEVPEKPTAEFFRRGSRASASN